MTNNIQISCILNTNNPTAKLGFEAWVDDQKFIDIEHVIDKQQILIEISDNEAEHELKFIMKNKSSEDTIIDKNGNIITNAMLSLKDISIDEILLGQNFTKLSVYKHNFNGTSAPIDDQFYDEMGCNGIVSLKFTTPIYLWFLEQL